MLSLVEVNKVETINCKDTIQLQKYRLKDITDPLAKSQLRKSFKILALNFGLYVLCDRKGIILQEIIFLLVQLFENQFIRLL